MPRDTTRVGKVQSQLENENLLRGNAFTFQLQKLPKLKFNCQKVDLPGVSSASVNQSSMLNPIHWDGGELTYEDLQITFIVDEELKNWIAIHDWIRENTGAIEDSEFDANSRFSDAVLTILTNKNNPQIRVLFHGCLPTAVSGIEFETTNAEPGSITSTVTFKYERFEIEIVSS